MAKVKVTLKHSASGHSPDQRATIRGLGLKKPGETVELDDNPSVRGMLEAVEHLVEFERVEE